MRTGSQTGNHHPAGYNYPTCNYNPSVYPADTPGRPDCYPAGRYSARGSCSRNKDFI
jgi:hypothetical protein